MVDIRWSQRRFCEIILEKLCITEVVKSKQLPDLSSQGADACSTEGGLGAPVRSAILYSSKGIGRQLLENA